MTKLRVKTVKTLIFNKYSVCGGGDLSRYLFALKLMLMSTDQDLVSRLVQDLMSLMMAERTSSLGSRSQL